MEQVNEHELEYRNGDHGVKYLVRGPQWEGGIILVKAGQELTPHKHEEVEETFYFETGAPQFVVDGESIRVRPGDAFRLDPGEAHAIINDTDEETRIIFIKTPWRPEDKIDL